MLYLTRGNYQKPIFFKDADFVFLVEIETDFVESLMKESSKKFVSKGNLSPLGLISCGIKGQGSKYEWCKKNFSDIGNNTKNYCCCHGQRC